MNKKHFYIMPSVGKVKYTVNIWDGVQRHEDGSPFYDIRLFKSKKKMYDLTEQLFKDGYVCT